jgi:hypothetical protein
MKSSFVKFRPLVAKFHPLARRNWRSMSEKYIKSMMRNLQPLQLALKKDCGFSKFKSREELIQGFDEIPGQIEWFQNKLQSSSGSLCDINLWSLSREEIPLNLSRLLLPWLFDYDYHPSNCLNNLEEINEKKLTLCLPESMENTTRVLKETLEPLFFAHGKSVKIENNLLAFVKKNIRLLEKDERLTSCLLMMSNSLGNLPGVISDATSFDNVVMVDKSSELRVIIVHENALDDDDVKMPWGITRDILLMSQKFGYHTWVHDSNWDKFTNIGRHFGLLHGGNYDGMSVCNSKSILRKFVNVDRLHRHINSTNDVRMVIQYGNVGDEGENYSTPLSDHFAVHLRNPRPFIFDDVSWKTGGINSRNHFVYRHGKMSNNKFHLLESLFFL